MLAKLASRDSPVKVAVSNRMLCQMSIYSGVTEIEVLIYTADARSV